jgi:hypothetical protein
MTAKMSCSRNLKSETTTNNGSNLFSFVPAALHFPYCDDDGDDDSLVMPLRRGADERQHREKERIVTTNKEG